jgi:hypothetical protein
MRENPSHQLLYSLISQRMSTRDKSFFHNFTRSASSFNMIVCMF